MPRMPRGLSPGQYVVLRLATIERQAKALTRTQIEALIRIRDQGPLAWCKGRGRAGGAVSRMFDRMEIMGLVTSAPHRLTEHGRQVLQHCAALTTPECVRADHADLVKS